MVKSMKVDYQSFARRILLGFRLQTPRIPPPNSLYVTFALFPLSEQVVEIGGTTHGDYLNEVKVTIAEFPSLFLSKKWLK